MNTQHTLPIYHFDYHKMRWNVLTIDWGRQDIHVKIFHNPPPPRPPKKTMQLSFICFKWSKVLNAFNMETQMNMYLIIQNFIFTQKITYWDISLGGGQCVKKIRI
jgi:hypothetical protein